ncbi:hypothetical protein [Rhodanobacter sp. BL-MT-08]
MTALQCHRAIGDSLAPTTGTLPWLKHGRGSHRKGRPGLKPRFLRDVLETRFFFGFPRCAKKDSGKNSKLRFSASSPPGTTRAMPLPMRKPPMARLVDPVEVALGYGRPDVRNERASNIAREYTYETSVAMDTGKRGDDG